MVTVYDPMYNTEYNSNFINELAYISAVYIGAYLNGSSNPENLTLGATSNVIFQSMNGVQMYINSNSSFSLYGTTPQGSNPFPFFQVSVSNEQTMLNASNLSMNLSGIATIGSASIGNSNNYQLFSTSNALGFFMNNDLSLSSNLVINDNITSYKNIACAGNIFSSTLNVFTNSPNCNVHSNVTRVGYSFHVNKYNQLELLRSDQYNSNSQVISKIQRVMTFGNSEFGLEKDNPNNYSVMAQFAGITGNYSNGSTPGMTDVRWSPIVGTSNIYYGNGFVGVGTNNPASRFHVAGTMTIEGDIVPKTDIVYNLGTSNKRFKDLYLSGNTISLAGSTISLDDGGNFTFLNSSGEPSTIAGWDMNGTNVFIFDSNVGINTSNPNFDMEVNGSFGATGYCNLFVDSYTSACNNRAPTASNLAVVYGIANTGKNTAIAASNAANTALSLAQNASNTGNNALVIAQTTSNTINTVMTIAQAASNNAQQALTVAQWASNAANTVNSATYSSNAAYYASNTAYDASNVAFSVNGIASYASNASAFASNAVSAAGSAFSSNTAAYASNISNSNSLLLVTISNAAFFSSNLANSNSVLIGTASNTAIYASNMAYSNTASLSAVSNAAYFASNVASTGGTSFSSNAAVWASNASYSNALLLVLHTSNLTVNSNAANAALSTASSAYDSAVYASNTSYCNLLSLDIYNSNLTRTSNAAFFASNLANNTSVSLSSIYAVLGETSNTAIYASNAASSGGSAFSSNTAAYASNLSSTNLTTIGTISNVSYTALSSAGTACNIALVASNLSGSNLASIALLSNVGYYASNNVNTAITIATSASNIANGNSSNISQLYGLVGTSSNTAIYASNAAFFASNAASSGGSAFGSNTAAYASNMANSNSLLINIYNSNLSIVSNATIFASNISASNIISIAILSNVAYFGSNAVTTASYASNTASLASNNVNTALIIAINASNITNSNSSSINQLYIITNSNSSSISQIYGSLGSTSNAAFFASNAASAGGSAFNSNTATYASNIASIALVVAQNASNMASSNISQVTSTNNTALFASNLAASNLSFIETLSNVAYLANTTANYCSNLFNSNFSILVSTSNAAYYASNMYSSNLVYVNTVMYLVDQNIELSSNLQFAYETAVFSSNYTISMTSGLESSSNEAGNALIKAVYASNAAASNQNYVLTISNAAYYASNAASSGGSTFSSNAAAYASNTGTYASNAAAFASNYALGLVTSIASSSNDAGNALLKASFTSNLIISTSNDLYKVKPSARDYPVSTSGFAFSIDGFAGTNPDIWVSPGLTYSFKLSTSGHPFQIRMNDGGSAVTDGMYWVGNNGTASGALANNGRQDGTLYWTVPQTQSNVVYQCQFHPSMVGNIYVNSMSGGGGTLTDSVSLASSVVGASAAAAKTCYDKAVAASNAAAALVQSINDLVGTSNLWNQGNTGIFTMEYVSIGKSNPGYELDVSGTVKADSVIASNIATKELQGSVVIGSAQSQLFTMDPSMSGNFYNLYVGPTNAGRAFFAQAVVMFNSDDNTAMVDTIASNNNISLSTQSSNVMISTSGIVGLTYKWSLYKT